MKAGGGFHVAPEEGVANLYGKRKDHEASECNDSGLCPDHAFLSS
jgi:hypothetical protein